MSTDDRLTRALYAAEQADRQNAGQAPSGTGMPAALVFDGRFDFPGMEDRPAACRLRVYLLADHTTVLVATELGSENPGPSVTNSIERLVSHAVAQFGFNPHRLHVFEHNVSRDISEPPRADGLEDFDEVTFTWTGTMATKPTWKPSRRATVEQLLGSPLH